MDSVWESSEVLRQFMDLGPGVQSSFLDSLKKTKYYNEEENIAGELHSLRLSLRGDLESLVPQPEEPKPQPKAKPPVAQTKSLPAKQQTVAKPAQQTGPQQKTVTAPQQKAAAAPPPPQKQTTSTPVTVAPAPVVKHVEQALPPSKAQTLQEVEDNDQEEIIGTKVQQPTPARAEPAPAPAPAPAAVRVASARPMQQPVEPRKNSVVETAPAPRAPTPPASNPEPEAQAESGGVPAWMLEED